MSGTRSGRMAMVKGVRRTTGKRLRRRPTGLDGPASNTRLWNAVAQHEPYMENLSVKDNKIFRFVQSKSLGNVMASLNSSAATFTKNWTTGDIVQFSSFASVFDQYRISKCEVWLVPAGPALAAGYANTTGARCYSVTDYDDSNNLSTSAQALQYENCMVSGLTDGHYRSVQPHIAVATYGGAFTQFKNEKAGWIDVASTSAQHYGVKCIVDPTNSNNDVVYNAFTRVTIEFRNLF